MLKFRSRQASRKYQLLPGNSRKSEAAKLPGSISSYQGTAENQKQPSFQGVSAVTREQLIWKQFYCRMNFYVQNVTLIRLEFEISALNLDNLDLRP